jgi:ribosomal protein L11 methylase PrmA
VVEVRQADLERPDEGDRDLFDVFDLVLANLTGALVVRAASTLAASIEAAGHMVVGGVTIDEEGEVVAAMSARALRLVRREEEDGWAGHVWARR